MAYTINILEAFDRIHPGLYISRYSDWILFTLLLLFFWAVVGISLKNRFEESRYFRILITAVSLMLSVGTYYSIYQGWFHLKLEGLGFFGIVLVLIVVFFVVLGLMRGYGIRLSNALPFGFLLVYISLLAISPNVLYTLARIYPLANLILGILFLISVFKIMVAFYHHSGKKPIESARDLQGIEISTPYDSEIDQEIEEVKKESKMLKKKTIHFTALEIKSLDNIEKCLKTVVNIIRDRGNSLAREDVAQITEHLKKISQNENILKRGMDLIKKHLNSYNALHRKDISELEKRLEKTKIKNKKNIIKDEIIYQQKMLEGLDFMNRYESKILQFADSFNKFVQNAMQKLKGHYPNDALSYLEQAYKKLLEMKHIYEKEREFEKYLLKLNKKTISELKKEKDPE